MCNILHLRHDVSRAKKKGAEYIGSSRPKIISAQDITISSTYTIIVLVKNIEGIQIWSSKKCHLFVFNCNTLSSYMSRTTRGRGKSENIIKLSRPCNGDPPTPLFDIGKTRVYRGSFNHFFFLIFALRHRLWVLV